MNVEQDSVSSGTCVHSPERTSILEFLRKHEHDVLITIFFVAGIVGIATAKTGTVDAGDEMWRLAENLAKGGHFADPFRSLPTGPTANNPPLYPALLALLMKILGTRAFVLHAAVTACILVNALIATLLARVSRVCFGDTIPGIAAGILWIFAMQLLPGWDTMYTAAGLLLLCVWVPTLEDDSRVVSRSAVAGLATGVLCLLNPAALTVAVAWIGYLIARSRMGLRRSLQTAAIYFAVLCLCVSGWCVRNYRELGAFVLRTNFGIALTVSNNDCAQSTLFRDSTNGCYALFHPNVNAAEAAKFRDTGEIRYDKERVADAKAWIRMHPAKFLRLTAERAIQFWFPAIETSASVPQIRDWVNQQNRAAYAIWIITSLSVPGLMLMARRREPVLGFLITVMVLYPLMYYVVVSDMRYRYPILWVSLLPAGYFVRCVVEKSRALQVGEDAGGAQF